MERSESMLDLTRLMLQHVDDRRLLLHRHLPALAEQVGAADLPAASREVLLTMTGCRAGYQG